MQDAGFNGTGSRFNSRFEAGSPIYAKQLNDLAAGVQASLPQPYVGVGPSVSFTAGGAVIAGGQEDPPVKQRTPLEPRISDDQLSIEPGTVNRYIPKLSGEYIDSIPAPTLTIAASGYVLVKVTYEAEKFFPRNAEIEFQDVEPPPPDSENESFYPLAKVNQIVEDGVTTYVIVNLQAKRGNLVVNRLKSGANMATWWWDVIT